MNRGDAHAALIAEIETATRAGNKVPCVHLPIRAWTSDEIAEQRQIAALCHTCPLLLRCRDYLDAHGERAGVWAGTTTADRHANTGKPKQIGDPEP